MNDVTRERIAKQTLSVFREVWCDRESDEAPFFNCDKCEFQAEDGRAEWDDIEEQTDKTIEITAWMYLPEPWKGGNE